MSQVPDCYKHVFEKFNKLQDGAPGRWYCLCPAHDDHKRSLSVAIGDGGRLVLKCHGPNCNVKSIVRALGLTFDDLFPDNKKVQAMSKAKVYQYRDERGELLFEAVRFDPKDFRQRRPNPDYDKSKPTDKESNPEYKYDLQGVRRVPYKLPELIAAVAKVPQRAILIVEGEKDVETAIDIGFVATCNPMGAGKWIPDYNAHFKGLNVIVIPDNDVPGFEHAENIAANLIGVAASVRIVQLPNLPNKGDFTDWIDSFPNSVSRDQIKREFAGLIDKFPVLKPGDIKVKHSQGTLDDVKREESKPEERRRDDREDRREESKPEERREGVHPEKVEQGGDGLKTFQDEVSLALKIMRGRGFKIRTVGELFGVLRMGYVQFEQSVTTDETATMRMDQSKFRQSLVLIAASIQAVAEQGFLGKTLSFSTEDGRTGTLTNGVFTPAKP